MFGVIGENPSCRHDFLVLEEGSVTGSFDGAVCADKVVVEDVAWFREPSELQVYISCWSTVCRRPRIGNLQVGRSAAFH
jgi:hypothetical protein